MQISSITATANSSAVTFTKYNVCGNSFVVLDDFSGVGHGDLPEIARKVLDSDFGLGADNMLVVERSSPEIASNDPKGTKKFSSLRAAEDFTFRIFEFDGTETLSCGNGLLSVAAHLNHRYDCRRARILTEIPSECPTPVSVGYDAATGQSWLKVQAPKPLPGELAALPLAYMKGNIARFEQAEVAVPSDALESGDQMAIALTGYLTFTGEPHFVVVSGHGMPSKLEGALFSCVPPSTVVGDELVNCVGRYFNINRRDKFPMGIHVDFARIVSSSVVEYRCYERAIDRETLACGTGALAVAHVLRELGLVDADDVSLWPVKARRRGHDDFLRVRHDNDGMTLKGRPLLVANGWFGNGADGARPVECPVLARISKSIDEDHITTSSVSPLPSEAVPSSQPTLDGRLKSLGLHVQPIPTISKPSKEMISWLIRERRWPFVIKDFAPAWRAYSRWHPNALALTHGHRLVTALMGLPSDGILLPKEQSLYERELPFSDFLEEMMDEGSRAHPCYLAYKRAAEIFGSEDYDFGQLIAPDHHATDTRVWIGSAGTRSMLHSDLKDNFFCQIFGRKAVTLVPWEESNKVYPFADNIVNSRIDLARVDIDQYPRLRAASILSTLVDSGDILFIPKGWWHDIRGLSPSVSLNHWFGSPLTLRDYMKLIVQLGPDCWWATGRDFVIHGVLKRPAPTRFFFSPPPTGKRLFDAISRGNFSDENDPTKQKPN